MYMIGVVVSMVHHSVKALICSWIQIRKLSEEHTPIFLMMSHSDMETLRSMDSTAMRECVLRW